jgi:mannose-6-phosphate isomerase-like protein (cupin superfamily)
VGDRDKGYVVPSGDAVDRSVDAYMTISEYFTGADDDHADLVTAVLRGPHSLRVNRRSTKLYFVLAGRLTGEVGDVPFDVGSGAAVRVPAGVPAVLHGDGTRILIVCAPPFSPEDETVM